MSAITADGTHTPVTRTREFILIILVIIAMALYFWTQSRYPSLNEKAMMGGSMSISAIGFNVAVAVTPDDPILWQIYGNTVNWMLTNKQGMTFGVAFAAALMSLLTLIQRRSFQGRLPNTLLGMFIGTPLGVCVNCAAPIGQGLYSGGAKEETALATMMSSPTLNIIVVSMLFSLFPLHIALLKIGLTIALILIAVPLFTRYFPVKGHLPAADTPSILTPNETTWATMPPTESRNWLQAFGWLITTYAKSLWFIIRVTVPLMALAGFLGAAFITLVPFDSLAGLLPHEGRTISLLVMALLAVIGAFLPVPMTFDIIIVAILIEAGFPMDYAMVLLFTLGCFSVYSGLIIWKSLSPKLAAAMFLAVAFTGVVAGVSAYRLQIWHHEFETKTLNNWLTRQLASIENAPPAVTPAPQGTALAALAPQLDALRQNAETLEPEAGIGIARVAFNPATVGNGFKRSDARLMGIDSVDEFTPMDLVDAYLHFRGIASADVHNDGWPDLLVTEEHGVALYANINGKRFERQLVDVPAINDWMVMNAALVDLNNDGWMDLYLSTYRNGHHVIYNNQRGDFLADYMKALPNQPDAITSPSAAFGDLDRDGDLDVAVGNWSLGRFTTRGSYDSSRNVWLENKGTGFSSHNLEGTTGETLSTLISDFDNDGLPDLLVGNDFIPPDIYYKGDGQGGLTRITREDGVIPLSTHFTMSIATGDMDNDLIPEIFLTQIAPGLQTAPSVETLCGDYDDPAQRAECLRIREIIPSVYEALVKRDVDPCLGLDTEQDRDGCLALFQLWRSVKWEKSPAHCSDLTPAWPEIGFVCERAFAIESKPFVEAESDEIPSTEDVNMLLRQSGDGRFVDMAKQMGLQEGSWSWNAKFADLDNDEWQDIFLVNGFIFNVAPRLGIGLQASNQFFHNQAGKGFKDEAEGFGLKSHLETLAYTYVDVDNDGDLDMVTVPMFGPLWFYENQSAKGNAIDHRVHAQPREQPHSAQRLLREVSMIVGMRVMMFV
ncbi:MAG: FG-GAP-like repeat-containing protein, partial [Gammaproteobacteria bacterium]